jgi:hypothetical protein
MNVEIGTEATKILLWECLIRFFCVVSCSVQVLTSFPPGIKPVGHTFVTLKVHYEESLANYLLQLENADTAPEVTFVANYLTLINLARTSVTLLKIKSNHTIHIL